MKSRRIYSSWPRSAAPFFATTRRKPSVLRSFPGPKKRDRQTYLEHEATNDFSLGAAYLLLGDGCNPGGDAGRGRRGVLARSSANSASSESYGKIVFWVRHNAEARRKAGCVCVARSYSYQNPIKICFSSGDAALRFLRAVVDFSWVEALQLDLTQFVSRGKFNST